MRRLRSRRQKTSRPRREHTWAGSSRSTAREVPKSLELEQRVARVEIAVDDIKAAIAALMSRVVAMQAHLDYVEARSQQRY
jgi:hypothetical protein